MSVPFGSYIFVTLAVYISFFLLITVSFVFKKSHMSIFESMDTGAIYSNKSMMKSMNRSVVWVWVSATARKIYGT